MYHCGARMGRQTLQRWVPPWKRKLQAIANTKINGHWLRPGVHPAKTQAT